jgi:hypothetical protein
LFFEREEGSGEEEWGERDAGRGAVGFFVEKKRPDPNSKFGLR